MIGKFMTRRTQPDYFQRILVVVMVGMRFARAATENAMIWPNEFALSHGFVDKTHCGSALRKFTVVLGKYFGPLFRMRLSPFSVSFSTPSSMLFKIIFNVFFVAFVNFPSVSLAVLAVPLLVFFEVCKSVLSVVLLACFRVFEWHGSYHTTNMSLTGGVCAQ